MRILGIDYGEKRVGMAISDPLGITAQPLPTLRVEDTDSLFREIQSVVSEKEVEEVVVGLPKNMDGTLGKSGQKVTDFIEKLGLFLKIPVIPEDERLTTMMADKALAALGEGPKVRKKKLDRVAAQLILQNYLDRKKTCNHE